MWLFQISTFSIKVTNNLFQAPKEGTVIQREETKGGESGAVARLRIGKKSALL